MIGPNDGREDLEVPDEVLRVLRGGAFWARSSVRALRLSLQGTARSTSSRSSVGFRVVVAVRP